MKKCSILDITHFFKNDDIVQFSHIFELCYFLCSPWLIYSQHEVIVAARPEQYSFVQEISSTWKVLVSG